jgi:DNA-binding GntR family transcriptional regulator
MKTNSLNKQEQAYEWLKSRILDGTYGPGCRLVIDRLAKEMGCSPIPVREAIRRLEAEGIVEFERFSGAKVKRIDPTLYAETLSVLAVLEGYATALASRNLGAEDFARLRSVNELMREARSNFDMTSYSELNQEFHRIIYEKCHTVRVSIFNLIPHRTTDSITEHEQLIRLMEIRMDEEVIERFARNHKLATLDAFQKWQARN